MCRNGNVDNFAINPLYPFQPGYSEICDEGAAYTNAGCSADCKIITNLWKCNLPGGTACYLACGDGVIDNGPANEPITYAYNEVCDEGAF